jgi:hypothetical protein
MKRRDCLTLLVFLVSAALADACPAAEPADLVLRGGKVATLSADKPTAAAVASRGLRS